MTAVTHLTNQSQFVQSNANFAGTNISGTINSSGISLSVAPGGGGADGYNILAAGTQTANTTGTILFSNSNGITFGMSNSSVITASHNGITSQTVQPVAVSGSNGSFSFSTLTFGNSNGLSFYTTNGSMVGSYTVPSVTNSSATISAGTTSNTLGNLVFSNSNGVSFGLNAGTITATVKTDYLTTARASNDAIGLNTALTAGALSVTANSSGLSINAGGLAGTSSGFAGNSISGSITHNTAGINISLNHPAWLTTAMQSNAVTISNINISAGTTSTNASAFTFNNANGITFGLGTGASAGSITASHNGLTTAAQSNQVVNSLNGSTGQISLNVGSSLSASTNGSSITFGLASNITTALQSANANYLTSQSNQAVSAANGSFTFQTLTFANSNGVSFSTGTQGLYASHNGLTTARASNDAIGLNTAGTNVTWTVNSSGLSLNASGYAGTGTTFNGTNVSGSITQNSNGIRIDLSAGAGGGVTPAISGSNGSFTFSTVSMGSSNNIHFYTTNGSVVASYADPDAWSILGNTAGASNTLALTNGTLYLSGGANITLSQNGSTIAIVGGAGAGGGVAISAGTNSQSTGTVNFSNSNNMFFGLNTNGVITASASTVPAGSLVYVNSNGISWGTSTAGATTSVTANVIPTVASTFVPGEQDYAPGKQFSSSSFGQNTLYLYPATLSANVIGSILRVPMFITNSSSAVSSGQKGQTIRLGIYTTNATNNTVLSLWQSTSYTIAASYSSNVSWAMSMITGIGNTTSYNTLTASSAGLNLSASLHGQRDILIPITATLSAGTYWFGFHHSTSGAGTVGNVLNISQAVNTWATFNRLGVSTNATGSGLLQDFGVGSYSTTTGALPNGISATQINQLGQAPVFYLGNETV